MSRIETLAFDGIRENMNKLHELTSLGKTRNEMGQASEAEIIRFLAVNVLLAQAVDLIDE